MVGGLIGSSGGFGVQGGEHVWRQIDVRPRRRGSCVHGQRDRRKQQAAAHVAVAARGARGKRDDEEDDAGDHFGKTGSGKGGVALAGSG